MAKKNFRDPIPEPSKPNVVEATNGRWNSDVIVELIRRYDIPYAALNPGASYRGLHDSLVNYGQNYPRMLLCQHEETAVQIAHGYARATGKPMIAILHNLVGLLHANMAIYYAYIDRAPIFIIGATGPVNETKRRPKIDWIHTASDQGGAIREYTKWDYQPATVDGIPESFARGYSTMMTHPQGPIYMCYDAWLQEEKLEREVPMPREGTAKVPQTIAPDPDALKRVAKYLIEAKFPLLMAEYSGRSELGFHALVELADTIQAAVYDNDSRHCFPSNHPLNLSMVEEVFGRADLLVGLDVKDWEKPTTKLTSTTRELYSLTSKNCRFIDIGFGELGISSWSLDYQRLVDAELRILADTDIAIPALTQCCRELLQGNKEAQERIQKRGQGIGEWHRKARADWSEQASRNVGSSPIPTAVLAKEVWEQVKEHDWVMGPSTLEGWPRKIWNFDKHYRRSGKTLGTSTQIGMSIGIALAHRAEGRLVINFQPDGDLMFDAGALWVVAKHKIPMLLIMYNNRAYYNDWEHQIRMAKLRGTPEDRAHIGMDIFGPEPDFSSLARSFGWYAEGPITKVTDLREALPRAIEKVRQGQPALLDAITEKR